MKKLLATLLLAFSVLFLTAPIGLADEVDDVEYAEGTGSDNITVDEEKKEEAIKDSSSFNVFDVLSIDEEDAAGQDEHITQNLVDEAAANNTSPIGALILRAINILSLLLGTFAVIMFMIGGIMFITAQGDESQTDRGKAIISQTIFGILIVLGSYLIVRMIISLFF